MYSEFELDIINCVDRLDKKQIEAVNTIVRKMKRNNTTRFILDTLESKYIALSFRDEIEGGAE